VISAQLTLQPDGSTSTAGSPGLSNRSRYTISTAHPEIPFPHVTSKIIAVDGGIRPGRKGRPRHPPDRCSHRRARSVTRPGQSAATEPAWRPGRPRLTSVLPPGRGRWLAGGRSGELPEGR